jgi:hypothetical protein
MLKNSGFNIEYSWNYHFRGGLIATSVELESDHPRFMDSSESVVLKSPETNLVPKNI